MSFNCDFAKLPASAMIVNTIADMDVGLASAVLTQDIGDLLGGRIFRDVLDQMDGEKFSGVVERIRSLENDRAAPSAPPTPVEKHPRGHMTG